jgi:aflatoxin B1 aldehyde reductase
LGKKVGLKVTYIFQNRSLPNFTAGAEQVRVSSLKEAGEILDVFQKHGHNEIDTALVYGGGSSEQYLGELDWQKRGLILDTKFSPRAKRLDAPGNGATLSHSPEDLRIALKRSLSSLKTDKVDMWYLHAPDRSVPYEVTMREVNNLYKEGNLWFASLTTLPRD